MFSIKSATETTIDHLEITIIAKKEARRSFNIYEIQFIVSALNFGTGRTGCC
jgi:hypothetical protein